MPNRADARPQRFDAYVERLATALGHRDRHEPVRAYVTGLCLPGDRKSIEPMAARVDPRHVRARHQSMHHFVANAPWDDAAVLRVARTTVLAALERHGPVAAWVVDDTGIPKKGRHSVGVARQYCGVLGKQDNCQVAVSVSLAHERASVPVAYRLSCPRRGPETAGAGGRRACRRRSRSSPNGRSRSSRWRSSRRGRAGRAGRGGCRVWCGHRLSRSVDRARRAVRRRDQPRDDGVGARPRAAAAAKIPGPRPALSLMRRTARHRPLSVHALAQHLPPRAWHTVTWREGTRGPMRSRFAAVGCARLTGTNSARRRGPKSGC